MRSPELPIQDGSAGLDKHRGAGYYQGRIGGYVYPKSDYCLGLFG